MLYRLSPCMRPCRRLLSSVSLPDAIHMVKHINTGCTDETVSLAVKLNVDPRKPNQSVRGSVLLPISLGKPICVAVIARGPNAEIARNAGADHVGDEQLLTSIESGQVSIDRLLCTPDMVGVVGKIARYLGPRGLMPSVKTGTVHNDIGNAVKMAKLGQVEFRTEKLGIVHAPVGKVSFQEEDIDRNLQELVRAIHDAKPSGAKGTYIRSATLCATRGHSIPLDVTVKPFTVRKSHQR